MFRRAVIATFVFAVVLVAACGRQITPEPTSNSNLAGHVVVRFRVNGTLAFSTYNYQIVIDTCGEGVPYPMPATNTVKTYSYSLNAGTTPFGGALQVYPTLFQYKLTTGTNGLTPLLVQPNPSYESFVSDSDGTGSEFELIFDRELLDNPFDLTQPCPSFTQPPAATTALAPSAAAGESPLARRPIVVAEAATIAPVATATVAPSPKPTVPVQSTWIMNFIVLDALGHPLDSLGPGGPSDVQFGGIIINTQSEEQVPVNKAPDSNGGPTDANAAIASGGEVDNYP